MLLSLCLFIPAFATVALAFEPRQAPSPFDALAVRGTPGPATSARQSDALPAGDALRAGWERFSSANGLWQAWLDERTGLPLLARGSGIEWTPARTGALPVSDPGSLDRLERVAREFLAANRVLLGAWEGQLELDRAASAATNRLPKRKADQADSNYYVYIGAFAIMLIAAIVLGVVADLRSLKFEF